MKSKLSKCWLFLFISVVSLFLGYSDRAQAQCGLSFTGPYGNTLTSFLDVYPNYNTGQFVNAYFNTIVQTTNQPLPLGTYLTWCVDANTFIDPSQGYTVPGTVYTGYLVPTCDPNLNLELPSDHPASCYVSPAIWQQVNYILNHKGPGYNFWDIEVALTTLVGGPPQGPSPPYPPYTPANVQAYLSAAASNAPSWVPQPGNVIGAVYVITNQAGVGTLTNAVQLELIEVPYCPITISCPTNVYLGCNPATIPVVSPTNITATSACGYPVNVTVSTNKAVAGCINYLYVTYTATDGFGDSNSCNQTISWTVDTAAPVLVSSPTNANLGINPTNLPTDASVSNQVKYSESCSTPVISVSHILTGTPCAETLTFYISAIDACGNKSITNTVVYTYVSDTNAPVITFVPPSTNFGCGYTSLPTPAMVLTNVTASDNCTVVSTNITASSTTNGSNVTLTYTITATDEAGNVSAPKTVVYTYSLSTGPKLVCATDITITGTNALPSVTGIPTLTDSCGNPIVCSNLSVSLQTNFWNFYIDSFTNARGCLNGRVPDSLNVLGQNWTAASSWNVDGTEAVSSNAYGNAFLPLPIQAGVLYQVSADVEVIGGSGTTSDSDWVALGFANGSTTSGAWYSVNNPEGWQLIRNSKNTVNSGQTFVGPGVSGGANDGFFPTNLSHYAVMVDTRPANPAQWTFSFYANSNLVAGPTAFGGSGPSVTTVGFGEYDWGNTGAICHVKNFMVGYAIPGLVTNSTSCSNLSYTDTVVSSACAGQIHVVRTWTGVDNLGRSTTCTQNIYETIPLPPVTFVSTTTNLGCSPTNFPTTASVASLVIGYPGLSGTNISSVLTTNGSTVTDTFTVTVKDACGNVSPSATLVYTWINSNGPTIVCAADITVNGTNVSPAVTGVPSLVDACGNPIVCTNFAVNVVTNFYNVYNDQFNASSCSLNGRGPDTVNATGAKWCSGSSWVVNGGTAISSNANTCAFLPFQPSQGYLYQVSADIECVAGSGTTSSSDWVALGFANGSSTSGAWYSVNNPVGWQLVRNSSDTVDCGQCFMGTGVSGGVNNGYFPTGKAHYAIILDTRPSNPANWTFCFLANGQVVMPPTAFGGSGPSISSVGFGEYCNPISGAICHVDNFCASYGVTALVTNTSCSNLTYTDKIVSGSCASTVHIVRTWTGWDNQGRTNTCTQNIYEKITLPAVTFASTTTNLGCSPSSLPTASTVAPLVIGYSGLAGTNISFVTTTNGCNVTRTFTVTVSDTCGNTSPAATLVYTWVNATPAVACWVSGPTTATCLTTGNYTCCITNLGNCPLSSCVLTACGQTFTCPALDIGKGCVITIPHTFQTCDLGNFFCQPVCTATAATACATTCSGQSSCKTVVCGQPSCKVSVCGPSCGWYCSPCTYTCCVTNTGTCPFSACKLTACGQTINCPTLQPGQGCSIPVNYSFQSCDVGLFNCTATASANCQNSTAPTCSGQATCSTPVYW